MIEESPESASVAPESAAATVDRALARAVLARALKLAFRRPTEQSAEALFTRAGGEALLEAALVLEDGSRGPLFRAAEALGAGPHPGLPELEARFDRVFGHTLRGSVVPYETEYGGDALFRQGQEMADLAGFYRAFGLRPGDGHTERLDHAGVEFEFLEILSLKEVYAIERGEAVMLEVTRDAVASFLSHHLGRFGCALGEALAR
jgi:TorA maturation chaperone TorD